jgi:uncharacterized protein YbcI
VSDGTFPSLPDEEIAISDRPEEQEEERGPEDPGDPRDARQPPTEQQVSDEVSREILRIHEESYGKGAGSAETFVGRDWVIVVMDDLELLPNEKFLVDNGKHDTVAQVRHQYQLAIQSSFRAAVERATGRTVTGFASTSSVEEEPRFVVEIFKLR